MMREVEYHHHRGGGVLLNKIDSTKRSGVDEE